MGLRLSLAARALVYGEKIEYSGPMFRSLGVEGDRLRLWFDHTGGGLQARGGGDLTGFKIAGRDGNFVPAEDVRSSCRLILGGVIRALAEKDDRVRGIKFRRNFGKAAALAAGFAAARGAIVITMDADLQDDPHEIPRFLAAVKAGTDVVSGWKKVRRDPWHKVLPSRLFNRGPTLPPWT